MDLADKGIPSMGAAQGPNPRARARPAPPQLMARKSISRRPPSLHKARNRLWRHIWLDREGWRQCN